MLSSPFVPSRGTVVRLTLNITHACNLACPYCFAGAARRADMPSEIGRNAVDWAVGRAVSNRDALLDVLFLGGEPTLAWDRLVELSQYARAVGVGAGLDIRIQMTTNATLLDDDRLNRLESLGVEVALSIDGIPEVHDRTRRTHTGMPTSAIVWDTLDRAVARLDSVSVIAVVNPATVRGLADAVQAFVAHGARRLVLNPDWTAVWEPDDLDAWRAGYERVAEHYLDAFRTGSPYSVNIFDEKIDLRIRGESRACYGCGSDPDDVAVAPSGRWYACGRAVGEDRPGNGALEPDEVLGTRMEARVHEACSGCLHRYRCASRCACANREASGDPHMPGVVLCWHERMVIPLADGVASRLYREQNRSFVKRFYGLEEVNQDVAATGNTL